MRLDSANRSFLAFMGVALPLGAYVLCGAMGGVLVPLLLVRVSHGGLAGLLGDGASSLASLPFVVLIAVGLALAGRSLARQVLASHRLARRVRGLARALPDQLTRAAMQAGLGGRVVLVEAPESFSFVYGALTPRVAVSRGLLESVSGRELRAVLEHERYHVCNLDPPAPRPSRALVSWRTGSLPAVRAAPCHARGPEVEVRHRLTRAQRSSSRRIAS